MQYTYKDVDFFVFMKHVHRRRVLVSPRMSYWLTVCRRQFVLQRSQCCNFSPSPVSDARVEKFDGVRSTHEVEQEGVRESSSVRERRFLLQGQSWHTLETRSAGRTLETRSASQREPSKSCCHFIESATDEWTKHVLTLHTPGSIGRRLEGRDLSRGMCEDGCCQVTNVKQTWRCNSGDPRTPSDHVQHVWHRC